jgi:hypothetical protein
VNKKLPVLTAAVLVVVIALVAARAAGVAPFQSTLPVSLTPPSHLSQINATYGWTIREGEWMKGTSVRFVAANGPAKRGYRLQVELSHNNALPSGSPTKTGRAGDKHEVTINGLANGAYRWWARFYNGSSVSHWVRFGRGTAFNVDSTPPSEPTVSSTTDPQPSKTYRSSSATFAWTSTDNTRITGYWYGLLPFNGEPPKHLKVDTTDTTATVSGLNTGKYQFDVAARDQAGNWSSIASFPLRVDSTPPKILAEGFSTFSFNPWYGTLTLNLRVSRPGTVKIAIDKHGTSDEVRSTTVPVTTANQVVHFDWNGRDDAGHVVPVGSYDFYVSTVDALGASSAPAEYSGLDVIDKHIVVSLSKQELWAYEGHKLIYDTLVTTGNQALPTPPGHFTILGKWAPFTFRSMDPVGSEYYYPPSPVNYAMLFRVGGYYIHDAPWRSVYGPGSNSQLGTPGENYTGSHGCINVPLNVMRELYFWTPDGTPVVVKR